MVQPAARDLREAVQVRDVVCGEEGGEDVADQTADGVLGEDIERVVDAQHELQLRGVVCACCANDAVDDGGPGGHEARAGCDGYKACYDAGAEAHGGPFALEAVVEHAPGDSADAGGEVGYDCGHHGSHVGCEGGTGVEAEPTDPEEDSADDDVCDIVGTIIELVSLRGVVCQPCLLSIGSKVREREKLGNLTPWPRRLPNMME